MAAVSGRAGTVPACGGGEGGRGVGEGAAGTGGHWTTEKGTHRALGDAALNKSEASGGNAVQC